MTPRSTSAEPKLAIMVVDDDATTRKLITRWLERAGFDVVQALDGFTALERLRREPSGFAVVVLDVMMPGLDGFQVISGMNKETATSAIPVILLTAHANQEEDVLRGIESGAFYHLEKPFSGPVLVARVRSLWERRRGELSLERDLAEARVMATTDPLTGLANRRVFGRQFEREVAFVARHKEPLALLMLDIDYFKSINDLFGHPAGDEVLVYFADQMRATLRKSDQAFRVGGEEFAVLLRETDSEQALATAARLRRAVIATPVPLGGDERQITFSAGVAAADHSNGFSAERLVDRADAALYRAKRGGRDRAERE